MRLRYHPLSPFVRKVVVTAMELGLDGEIERVPTDVWSPETDVADDNPLGKVPALVTEDGTFVGSLLICQYLDFRAGGGLCPPANAQGWPVLQLHAFADGIMEACVMRTMETVRRPGEYTYPGTVARQEAKIVRTLDRLEISGGYDAATVDIATITLACSLGYLDRRAPHLEWRSDRPRLTAFYEAFARRPSMQSTQPPAGHH